MKDGCKTNTSSNNARRITLKGYYQNLPSPTYPKKELINELAQKCNVTSATVRNWIIYGFKPDNQEHIEIISEVTGIPKENLWND